MSNMSEADLYQQEEAQREEWFSVGQIIEERFNLKKECSHDWDFFSSVIPASHYCLKCGYGSENN